MVACNDVNINFPPKVTPLFTARLFLGGFYILVEEINDYVWKEALSTKGLGVQEASIHQYGIEVKAACILQANQVPLDGSMLTQLKSRKLVCCP